MNTRLKRPLLAVAISGALLAGGSAFAAPAFAGTPVSSIGAVLADEPTADPNPSTPAPTPTDTVSPTPTSTDTVSPAPTDTTTPTPEPTDTTSPAPTPTATTTAPAGDVTAPTGSLKLNLSSIWIGQKVSLTQVGVADETSGPNDITRVVTWGDGTSSTLTADPAPVVKQYTKAGTFKVTLKLTDAAGNSTLAYGSVAVTVPGHVAFSTTSVWPGQKFDIKVSAVPAGTTKISLDWGDGYVSVVKGQNFSVRGYYYHYHGKNNNALVRGAIPVRIVYTNKNGATSWIPAGKVNVRTDSWKPTVKVTKPAKSNQASSWKTLSGTVSDKGAGAPYAYVWLTRTTSNAVYCFTPKMKWARVYSEAEYDKVCVGVAVKVSNGKWSLKVGGVQKGTLYVDARAWDWADNASSWSSLKVNITR